MTSPEDSGITRVLMIDDDRRLCALVRDYLTPMGYHVEMVHTGTEGAEMAVAKHWHAVLLDVMLPGCDGFEVLKRIRAKSMVPVLMLTARGDESDRIVGLEIGADDYLPKTFSTRELLARLRAATRRAGIAKVVEQDKPIAELHAGPIQLNPDARLATLDGKPLALTPVEYDLLAALMKAKGRIKTREHLLDSLRDREWGVFDRSIDVHIAALRKKLGDDAHAPRFIRTVRAAGYLFIDPNHPA
jgi:two-component system response regulator CpxR